MCFRWKRLFRCTPDRFCVGYAWQFQTECDIFRWIYFLKLPLSNRIRDLFWTNCQYRWELSSLTNKVVTKQLVINQLNK